MRSSIFFIVIFFFISCNKQDKRINSNEELNFEYQDLEFESNNLNFENKLLLNSVLSHFLIDDYNNIPSKYKYPIKLSVFDATIFLSAEKYDLILKSSKVNQSNLYRKLNNINNDASLLLDSNMCLLQNIVDTNYIKLNIVVLNHKNDTTVVLLSYLLFPDWGAGYIYKIDDRNNFEVIKKDEIWVN